MDVVSDEALGRYQQASAGDLCRLPTPPLLPPFDANTRVYSFDVFDTCLTRYYAEPTDLFKALFTRLLIQAGVQSHEIAATAIRLARLRMDAEAQAREQARQQSGADDVALSKIYQRLEPILVLNGLSMSQAIAEEIEIELAAVSPILSTRLRIRTLRDRGHPIAFISDMYLPGSVVRQMLIEHGFTNGGDRVYVSADLGLSKGSGRLFSHVCQQLGIEPKQLHHTGDNLYADVYVARKQGLQATYFVQSEPTRYEKGFRSELLGSGMASHLVGLSRAVRLRHDPGSPNSQRHAAIAADVLAPLLTGYIAWVLMSAQQIGIEQLHFVDEGLWAIAQQILLPWQQLNDQSRQRSGRAALDLPLPICCLLTERSAEPELHGYGQQLEGQIQPGRQTQPEGQTKEQRKEPQRKEPPTTCAFVGTGCPVVYEQSELMKRWMRKVNYGYRFFLLGNTDIGDPKIAYPKAAFERAAPESTDFAYFDAPLSNPPSLEGIGFLFEYRQILSLIFSFVSSESAYGYRSMVLDYAATFGRSPSLRNHTDMVKRYAAGNLIALLSTPTAADVRTLNDLQLANKPNQQLLMARPIGLWELPAISKRLVRGESVDSFFRLTPYPVTESIRWIEGALTSSSKPVKLLVVLMRWVYRLVFCRSRRDRWFYQRH